MIDTAILGGMLPNGEIADIFIEKGVIKSIASANTKFTLDAGGCFVMPGGIDPHTHVNLNIGESRVKDGWVKATYSAAIGGTTCLIEHPSFGSKIEDLLMQAEGNSYIDYGFHAVFEPSTDTSEIPQMIERGISSGKVYMTYSGMLNDKQFIKIMKVMGRAGGLTAVHAENDAIISELSQKFQKDAPHSPISHARSRPDYCEAEAVNRAIAIARAAEAPLYIVHLSTKKGLEIIRNAKNEGVVKVYAETCPQYLLWTEEKYNGADGMNYIMAPPLRKQSDCDALWDGLADGSIDTIGTDHCYFVRKGDDVFNSLGGVPGIGKRLSDIFRAGVMTGKISPVRFAELISEAPAKIFGVQNKGSLKEGFDADIAILDKTGGVRDVFLRGTPLVLNYKFAGKKIGNFIRRSSFQQSNRVNGFDNEAVSL